MWASKKLIFSYKLTKMKVIKIKNKKIAKETESNLVVGTIIFIIDESNKDDFVFASDKASEFRSKKLTSIINKKRSWYKALQYEITEEGGNLVEALNMLFKKISKEKRGYISINYILSFIRLMNLIKIAYRIK